MNIIINCIIYLSVFFLGAFFMDFLYERFSFKRYFNSVRFKRKLAILRIIPKMYSKPNLNNILMLNDNNYLVKTDEHFYIIRTHYCNNNFNNSILFENEIENLDFDIITDNDFYEIKFNNSNFSVYA